MFYNNGCPRAAQLGDARAAETTWRRTLAADEHTLARPARGQRPGKRWRTRAWSRKAGSGPRRAAQCPPPRPPWLLGETQTVDTLATEVTKCPVPNLDCVLKRNYLRLPAGISTARLVHLCRAKSFSLAAENLNLHTCRTGDSLKNRFLKKRESDTEPWPSGLSRWVERDSSLGAVTCRCGVNRCLAELKVALGKQF